MENKGDITVLLRRAADGDPDAFAGAVAAAYSDLERMARKQLRKAYGQRADDATLEPPALVHETFLKLKEQRVPFENRAQFFAIASRAMVRALVDYQRARGSRKRGGQDVRVSLSGLADAESSTLTTLTAFAQAMERLEDLDRQKSEVVKLKVLWGFGTKEIASILDVSVSTVERHWRFARAWLADELGGHQGVRS
jgi:RNA polymerase sigma-70 factor (ECF subfamily)